MKDQLPPKENNESQNSPAEYHRKSDIEKYVEEPIRAVTGEIKAYVDAVAGDRERQEENQHSRDKAEERRHQEHIAVQNRASKISALLSAGTIVVLVCTVGVYLRQANIMKVQATIMDKQREITENTLPAMRAQASAAITAAAAAKSQADSSKVLADEARRTREPFIVISVKPRDFNTAFGKLEIEVENVGGSPAKAVSIRSHDWVLPKDWSWMVKDMDPRGLKLLPSDEGQDILDSMKVERAFSASLNPNLAFDQQAPVLPPESIFEIERRIDERSKQQNLRAMPEEERKNSSYPYFISEGTKMQAVGDLAPQTGLRFFKSMTSMGRPLADAVQNNEVAVYLACRAFYTDQWGETHPTSDYCFQYHKEGFGLCLRPEKSEGKK